MEMQSQKRQDAQIAAAMAKAGRGAAVPGIQFGRAVLNAGTVAVTGVVIGGGSRIYVAHSTPNGSTGLGILQSVPTSPTTFTINAITAGATTVLATDVSDVDWLIVG